MKQAQSTQKKAEEQINSHKGMRSYSGFSVQGTQTRPGPARTPLGTASAPEPPCLWGPHWGASGSACACLLGALGPSCEDMSDLFMWGQALCPNSLFSVCKAQEIAWRGGEKT